MTDMVIHCPRCGDQHIDEPDPEIGWTNPPHKSHLCLSCGVVWRVADVPTNGVAATQTQGKLDNWFPPLALAVGVDPAFGDDITAVAIAYDGIAVLDIDIPVRVGDEVIGTLFVTPCVDTQPVEVPDTADVDDHGHDLRIEGDEYVCNKCHKRWGFDDLEVPVCG